MRKLLLFLLAPLAAYAAPCAYPPCYYNQNTINPNNSFYKVFDIANYGAKCNGSHDDTAAIQVAAAAATAAGGGTLLITPGNCVISNTTTIGSNTTVSGYGATITPVASGSWHGTITQQTFILATNATNVTVQGINFAYPSTGYTGACHIIESYSTNSKIVIRDNTSNYCGDLMANIGSSYVLMTNNQNFNMYNSCYDSWHGATNVTVSNNFCSLAGSGANGIFFTGYHNPGPTGDTNNGLIAIGNTIIQTAAAEVGIQVNGALGTGSGDCSGGATDDNGIIANNRIYMAAGAQGRGIIVRFCAHNWDVHDNQIYNDGTDQAEPAIEAITIATNVMVHHNLVYDWTNSTVGSERGVFKNNTVGGTITFNECYSCTSASGLTGQTDSTTMIFANDTGTGVISFVNILATGNIEAGASGQFLWTGRGILTSTGTGQVQLGAANAASPIAQILATQGSRSGTDVDISGANLTIASGRGTGASTGSTMSLSTPAATTTGSGAQAFIPRITLSDGVVALAGDVKLNNRLYASATLPTIASGFNTSGGSITAISTAAFSVTVGTSTGTSTGVLTMPTSTTGWACSAADVTTPATHAIQQTGSGTTSVTVTDYNRTTGIAQNMINSDVIVFHCGAF